MSERLSMPKDKIRVLLLENINEVGIRAIVKDEFLKFFNRNVLQYPEAKRLPINFSGSIAFYFKEILNDAALELNLKIGKIIQAPMEGLIEFHKMNVPKQIK